MTEFGVQDKKRGLLHSFVRTMQALTSSLFRSRSMLGIDAIGTSSDRSSMATQGEVAFSISGGDRRSAPDDDWIRRWKIDLSGIVPELIDRMNAGDVVRAGMQPDANDSHLGRLGQLAH